MKNRIRLIGTQSRQLRSFRFCVVALAALIVLSLAGCVTNAGVYDKSVPAEQQAHLVIPRGGALGAQVINAFDGNQVTWADTSLMGQFGGKFLVDIPSGEHTLVGMRVGVGAAQASMPTVTYDFLAGHTYRIEVGNTDIVVTDITK